MVKRLKVDAICDGEDYSSQVSWSISKELVSISGDSISVYPAQTLSQKLKRTIIDYTGKLARELKVVGLVNIQYVIYNDEVYVIEVNPRASRTVPFLSKVTDVPMAQVATNLILGKSLAEQGYKDGLYPESNHVHVKAPVFSFTKLAKVDSSLDLK